VERVQLVAADSKLARTDRMRDHVEIMAMSAVIKGNLLSFGKQKIISTLNAPKVHCPTAQAHKSIESLDGQGIDKRRGL
jgi:hypothetical protein